MLLPQIVFSVLGFALSRELDKQEIQKGAPSQFKRRQMQEALAGRAMSHTRWRPKAARNHVTRKYLQHVPPRVYCALAQIVFSVLS